MPDETQQQNPEPAPISTESQNSEVNSIPESPQEPMADTPIPPTDSTSIGVPPVVPESSAGAESAIPVKDPDDAEALPGRQNDTNEPFDDVQGKPSEKPNITIEKHGNDVTITEVMQPTAQMAGNEPIDTMETEKIKKRKENLEKANIKRQSKKREKIDAILDLFAKQTNLTNDEVEKLLHVSDATATRYLEILEKEGKIKQIGKTGRHTHYQKI